MLRFSFRKGGMPTSTMHATKKASNKQDTFLLCCICMLSFLLLIFERSWKSFTGFFLAYLLTCSHSACLLPCFLGCMRSIVCLTFLAAHMAAIAFVVLFPSYSREFCSFVVYAYASVLARLHAMFLYAIFISYLSAFMLSHILLAVCWHAFLLSCLIAFCLQALLQLSCLPSHVLSCLLLCLLLSILLISKHSCK